jgi:hypothetical protein
MLAVCRLAALSALGAHYAPVNARTQFGARRRAPSMLKLRQSMLKGTVRGLDQAGGRRVHVED